MISCIFVLYLAAFAHLGTAPGFQLPPSSPQSSPQPSPDALYARRDDLGSATRAADVWAGRLQRDGRDFEAAWKLARARYWLGGHADARDRRQFLEHGIAAARTAVALQPGRPEGHFWLAANMGALAESFGLRQGLKYRDELQTVLRLDPGFQQGSADRALGRWYLKVPGLAGGSKKKSEEHLRRSLAYNANSISSRFFLAETLLDMDRRTEAIAELQRVTELQPDPEWIPEDREFKDKAQRLLTTLRQKR
ncbi:MAG TPA: TRAP transporter TatT component family protein [Vicinamibacterales bacterium]|nr:TRAP transporter TatT component family protein [Vicinamibacterales bacterium]